MNIFFWTIQVAYFNYSPTYIPTNVLNYLSYLLNLPSYLHNLPT
jgi:hypothetical protein